MYSTFFMFILFLWVHVQHKLDMERFFFRNFSLYYMPQHPVHLACIWPEMCVIEADALYIIYFLSSIFDERNKIGSFFFIQKVEIYINKKWRKYENPNFCAFPLKIEIHVSKDNFTQKPLDLHAKYLFAWKWCVFVPVCTT